MCVFRSQCQFDVAMLGRWTVKTSWRNVGDWTIDCDTFNWFVINDQVVKNSRVSTYRWTCGHHKAENWGYPDIVNINELTPMSVSLWVRSGQSKWTHGQLYKRFKSMILMYCAFFWFYYLWKCIAYKNRKIKTYIYTMKELISTHSLCHKINLVAVKTP